MALIDDLQSETDTIVRSKWERRDGTVVPEISDLGSLVDYIQGQLSGLKRAG